MADEGYDPKKSKVSSDRMDTWRGAPVSGDLQEVPGIGPAAVKALSTDVDENERITNTHQLFGKYLMLKGPDSEDEQVDVSETNQKFWYWLKSKGIKSHRSAIVLAVNTKLATFMPGLLDANVVDDSDVDEDE